MVLGVRATKTKRDALDVNAAEFARVLGMTNRPRTWDFLIVAAVLASVLAAGLGSSVFEFSHSVARECLMVLASGCFIVLSLSPILHIQEVQVFNSHVQTLGELRQTALRYRLAVVKRPDDVDKAIDEVMKVSSSDGSPVEAFLRLKALRESGQLGSIERIGTILNDFDILLTYSKRFSEKNYVTFVQEVLCALIVCLFLVMMSGLLNGFSGFLMLFLVTETVLFLLWRAADIDVRSLRALLDVLSGSYRFKSLLETAVETIKNNGPEKCAPSMVASGVSSARASTVNNRDETENGGQRVQQHAEARDGEPSEIE